MTKTKLFLDADNTILNSSQTYCEIYNLMYQDHPNFVPANHDNLKQWDLKDICPLVINPVDVFSSEMFWDRVGFYDVDTLYVLDKLLHKYDVWVCSIGTIENITRKLKWFEQNTSIHNYAMITNADNTMCKDVVNMAGGIFVDDVASNLFSSNASWKICFGKKYPWNSEWSGDRVFNCNELDKLL